MKRFPMWEKQKETLVRCKKRGKKGTGLLLEMGCGKTRIAIKYIEHITRTDDAKLILIGAPLSVLHVWIEEWDKWADAPILFIDLHKTGSEGLKAANQLVKGGYPVICLVNYEYAWRLGYKMVLAPKDAKATVVDEVEEEQAGIKHRKPRPKFSKVSRALIDMPWDLVILDESSAIKTPSTRATKAMLALAPIARHRLILNGTAYTKRPLDVYTQLKFVSNDSRKVIPKTFEAFRVKYAIPHPVIPRAVAGYQNLDDLAARIKMCCVILKKEDMLDLPPFTHENRYAYMSPTTMKLYHQIKEEMYAELETLEHEGVTITVQHLFAVHAKLLQITSGFIRPDVEPDIIAGVLKKTPKTADPIWLDDGKIEVLFEVLDERDDPTLIVTNANPEEARLVEAIKKRYGYTPKVLNGSVKGENRLPMIKAAEKDPAFIVKMTVAALGVDMRAFDMTIFFSHRANTEKYYQMLSRNHRGGQTKPITYVHLLVPKTVDIRIMDILTRDLDVAKQIEDNWRALL